MIYQASQKLLIAGPCAIESEAICMQVAQTLKSIEQKYPILKVVFKSSFDKANRLSFESHRGMGLEKGLEILNKVKSTYGFPILSDIHESYQAPLMAEVCDVLQIPAFLCRQTDLLLAAAATGKTVNVKKGQFLSPHDMQYVVRKLQHAQAKEVWQTERGTSFGYNNLVVDMKAFQIMHANGAPVIFDLTHSLQLPGAAGGQSGGQLEFAESLGRAACATGYVDGLFIETHPDPKNAISDKSIQSPLDTLDALIAGFLKVWTV
jgi:2-dehydro-3-deoxyphosphooctonate aldolase (KDO 8-P synthase)